MPSSQFEPLFLVAFVPSDLRSELLDTRHRHDVDRHSDHAPRLSSLLNVTRANLSPSCRRFLNDHTST